MNPVIKGIARPEFEDGLRTGVLKMGFCFLRDVCTKHIFNAKDACIVKPGFISVPPQLYFEFAALILRH